MEPKEIVWIPFLGFLLHKFLNLKTLFQKNNLRAGTCLGMHFPVEGIEPFFSRRVLESLQLEFDSGSIFCWGSHVDSTQIVEDWGIGCEVDIHLKQETKISRAEIARIVEQFMDSGSKVGQRMRTRASELGDICNSAVAEGGSSRRVGGLGDRARAGDMACGPSSLWANNEAGLLPTPTTQDMAARRGKANMPVYDNVGPLNYEEEGSRAWVPNGLGLLV
ncbi:unnamed protein product [Linum tenue]|uniref:Uncharacterized protein n=1 Tax=Linum tenue TaxID=586396 RepID=A0AAV0IQ67_9ROSI|nr:unnamed protein product [Linum tenue]